MADCPVNNDGIVMEGDCEVRPGNTLRIYAPEDLVVSEEPARASSLPLLPPSPPPPAISLPVSPPAPRTANRRTVVPDAPTETPAPSAPDAAEEPVAGEATSAETTEASTEVPADNLSADDLSKLAASAGGDSTMVVVLGLLGLAGAGTTWKFLTLWSEQRHEQKMKQLDIDERASGLGAASPPPCQAAHLKLEAELAETKGRLAAIEKKSMSLSADFDGDDLERQVKKLARTVKAMQEDKN